ncbi:MAG: ribosome maturation factor RimM [Acidimicrobiia bacterium]|nr:MAG: ribosome maturation factor RimM [Acidimicrobiia bacterium]
MARSSSCRTTNVAGRFDAGAVLYCDGEAVEIATSRPHQGALLVRFVGVEDRTGAERLRNKVLTADALAEPPEGEVWVHELIGAEVRDGAGAHLGRVVAVEANPAHDLLVLDGGGLVPMVFVVETAPGVVVVDVPEGLL